jgi:energy-converting hydrogenase A subunit L
MEELFYMIYIIVFIAGSIAGLLLSYKKHMEPYIISEIDILTLVFSIIGWFLLLNHGLLSFISSEILLVIAFFLIGLAIGRRPGYGRKETAIGILIAAVVWIFTSGLLF